ncbi:hypothetical protein NY486_19295, partial [Enterobacter hormaechei]|nr:hypothetical protein [Enterobacter hormaechei]
PIMPVNKAHPSTSVFKDNIFNGQVVFITGGEYGAPAPSPAICPSVSLPCWAQLTPPGRSGIGYTVVETLMRHGADAVIVGRDAKGLA